MLTEVDLAAVIRLHRERKAKATIVLTPVDNPTAYGLVETDAAGNIQRFLEKPKPDEITCNTINAGIYVLEPDTFDRIPEGHAVVDRAELLPVAHRARRDVRRATSTAATGSTSARRRSTCRCTATSWTAATAPRRSPAQPVVGLGLARGARSRKARVIEGPCFIDEGAVVKAGARIGPYTVIGRQCHIEEHAVVDRVDHLAQHPHQPGGGRPAARSSAATATSAATPLVENGVVLGDKSVVTDYSRL